MDYCSFRFVSNINLHLNIDQLWCKMDEPFLQQGAYFCNAFCTHDTGTEHMGIM